MKTKGLTLDVRLPTEPSTIETDVTKVRQILLNLLTNAGKFTARGTVQCQLTGDADTVAIEVIDTGRGIAPNDLPRVFDVVWQGASADRERPEGVGLGLSVSRRLARLLGGDITVSSVLGHGSVFRLRLSRQLPNDAGEGGTSVAEDR
jgi:signal transduction histidine kinase